jgi:pyruvate dehydrogenase E1 component alpha subunit
MAVANEVERRSPVRKPDSALPAQDAAFPLPENGNGNPAASAAKRRVEMLRMMMLIRRFEERTYAEYTKPKFEDPKSGEKYARIGGFCHLYSGQEAVAVGIADVFQKGKDYLINGYRCHGHSLALGMEARPAMAELLGRATGCSKGKGGSMHLFQAEVGNMGGHGIVGGQLPLGIGFGFAAKYKKTGGCSFTLFGDGAINQGTHNEALNLASLLKLPVIFMVENNGVAMGTQVARHSAEQDLAKRGLGYNMPIANVDGNDVDTVITALNEATARARRGDGPTYLSMNTYRFRGHSMSDAMAYRTKEESEKARLRDPITLLEDKLIKEGLVDADRVEAISAEVTAIVEDAVQFAENSPHPDVQAMYDDVSSETYPLQK